MRNTRRNLPSIFEDDSPQASDDPSVAFGLLLDMTAAILGALIAQGLIAYRDDPFGAMERAERAIAEAIDSTIEVIDLAELMTALESRRPDLYPPDARKGKRG